MWEQVGNPRCHCHIWNALKIWTDFVLKPHLYRNVGKLDIQAEQFVQSVGQVRQQKAAGCYPWTHLTHNEEEEVAVETELFWTAWVNFKLKVWIDPLSLPQDLSREAILRRDGTVPSEWFHLPEVPPFLLIRWKILTIGCSRPNRGGDAQRRLARVWGRGGGRAGRSWNGGGARERGGEEKENSQRKKNTSLWKT